MKIEEVNSSIKNSILLSLVTNTEFLSKYCSIFGSERVFFDMGASWVERKCIEFFNKYQEAPSKNMRMLYEKEVESASLPPDEIQYIQSLLVALSDTNIPTASTEVLIDTTIEYANRIRISRLAETLDSATSSVNADKVIAKIKEFKAVEKGEALPVVSIFDKKKIIEECFREDSHPLIKMSNKYLQQEIAPLMYRGSYTVFRAGPKVGKTQLAFNLALKFLEQGYKVGLFECGDLSESDAVKRLCTAISGYPTELETMPRPVPHPDCLLNKYNKCMSINRTCIVPYIDSSGSVNKEYKPCTSCRDCGRLFPECSTVRSEPVRRALTQNAVASIVDIVSEKYQSGGFKLYTYGFNSLGIDNLKSILDTEIQETGRPFDALFIDYIGLLKAPSNMNKEPGWVRLEALSRELRNIALEYNLCNIVLEQSNIRTDKTTSGLLTEDSYSGGASTTRDATAVVCLSRDTDTRGVIKMYTPLCRKANLTSTSGGYLNVYADFGAGSFFNEVSYVSDEAYALITQTNKELGLVEINTKSSKK